MVPEVGREAIVDVRASIEGMADLTKRVIDSAAETVILISPHAPLEADAFVAYDGPQLFGDFTMFRAPGATVHAELDDELLNRITLIAGEQELAIARIKGFDLDHGTAVPLYFLQRNGWQGRVIALGYSFLSNEDHLRFGRCIRQAIDEVARPIAFIASGDLSHRLKRDAPAGYNVDAHFFDEEVVDAIRSNSSARIVNIDQELRRVAGECGYRSILVAIGVAQGVESKHEVISYEAPFGVGYLVAQLSTARPSPPDDGSSRNAGPSQSVPSASGESLTGSPIESLSHLPALARRTVETFISTGRIIDADDLSELLKARAACFVSIKTKDGELRGCIGTFEPAKDTLAEELIANAISAATRDPRFSPVTQSELPHLKYSVDVLSAPEPATLDDLDPLIYGVIVEDENAIHRGLLLPNLEGVDSGTQQVAIAARKAGIKSPASAKLYRFRADRYSE
jgi:AmmeMemoRadiSam system protein A/AmmeMemoRadiSam system protein B